MIDLNTDKVILSKPVRRKTFILGKSVALTRKTVAVMDDGTIRVITDRRPEFWDYKPTAPLVVSFGVRRASDDENFRQTINRVREMERDYITAELPETV
ncbi:hypothetical protein ACR6C2_16995 [Streptomyces sp. INA 01156]